MIISEEPFVLLITDPVNPPSFIGSGGNEFLYRSMAGSESVANEKHHFAEMMLQARSLLESTYAINTLAQLTDKKNELTGFITQNYHSLRHSDMIPRLMAQLS